MSQIQFISVTPQQLKEEINKGVQEVLKTFFEKLTPKQPNEYLTRQEVADMFKVDISTVHNWCKSGKLKPYGIGARVYFLRADIDNCLIPLNN
ncbi:MULTISPECIES: helix-turn-helix domain-containing protein [Myroides]|uniref:helix-turn-helix domain-containing protein n=1 Tax=Myroides TaxID=76831 RepID=UPI000742021C|nr:helix-turn-helix domain-containing protein [Myroides marinus]KUF45254.1 DNA-binding protein [Myroides marinus]